MYLGVSHDNKVYENIISENLTILGHVEFTLEPKCRIC